jgi:hypothetical protein
MAVIFGPAQASVSKRVAAAAVRQGLCNPSAHLERVALADFLAAKGCEKLLTLTLT